MNRVKLLVMDIDGTLTDGIIYISETGEFFKAFDIKDGCGIHDILPKVGIEPVIITVRKSSIIVNRCNELSIIYCYQGCRNKEEKIKEIARQFDIVLDKNGVYSEIAYIRDDVIDIPCMRYCGVVGCPADVAAEVQAIAHFISEKMAAEELSGTL